MPSPSTRWHRALAAVAALTAVLAGALLCVGTSTAADTGGTAGAGRPQVAVAGSGAVARSAAVTPRVGVAASAAVAPQVAVAGPTAVGPQAAVPPNGAVAAAAVAPQGAAPPPAAVAPPATAAKQGAAPAGEHRAPGCGEGSADGGLSPATPPRGSAAHELLPALPTTAHGGAGCPAAEDAVLDLAPERAPPALAAPGPIDLSVLRV
ncbi:hypothetical protein [Streptomyces marianii]|uniref:hypothetical protein n=1 Tax=Streptomyces marianii TaxID=1817406 RepID=UPI00148621B8|nr:hypothetical protein [Streptomyces marianii]